VQAVHLPIFGTKRFRFECTRCGECCRKPGVVYLGRGEAARLAAHLGMEELVFRARYVTRYSEDEEAIEVPGDTDGCPLLDGDLCSVEAVKPNQCRAYPFWPELVEDPEAWELEKAACEGIGRGRVWRRREVEEMMLLELDVRGEE
jgi:Fe-S-cluster containining protein